MAQFLIGAAAALAVIAAALLGYRAGKKAGCGALRPRRLGDEGAAAQQDALMKKYEAILDYDPYGERV